MTALMETASSKVTSAQGLHDRSQSSRAHLPHFEPHTPTAPSANPTTDDAPASTPIEPIASYTANFLSKGRVIGHTRMSNDCDLGPSANSTHIRTRRHAPRTSKERERERERELRELKKYIPLLADQSRAARARASCLGGYRKPERSNCPCPTSHPVTSPPSVHPFIQPAIRTPWLRRLSESL